MRTCKSGAKYLLFQREGERELILSKEFPLRGTQKFEVKFLA